MKKTATHLFIKIPALLLPVAMALALFYGQLSDSAFTFRSWEALLANQKFKLLPGPYFPNQDILRWEEGDLGHHTAAAVSRKAHWLTDRYGYRNRPRTECTTFPWVVVGDSLVVGTGLTQSETFSEVLSRKTGECVYAYAPESVRRFLYRYPLIAPRPKTLVHVVSENWLMILEPLADTDVKDVSPAVKWVWKLSLNSYFQKLMVFKDRVFKTAPMNYFCAHAGAHVGQKLAGREVASTAGTLLFRPTNSFTAEQESIFLDRISQYSEVVRARGVQYLFVPIPNRETIAASPDTYENQSAFFNRLVAGVERRGVSTFNILPAYRALYLAKELPFQSDDTHWNALGVQVAVDRTISAVAKGTIP